jgi:hypothetical protein
MRTQSTLGREKAKTRRTFDSCASNGTAKRKKKIIVARFIRTAPLGEREQRIASESPPKKRTRLFEIE